VSARGNRVAVTVRSDLAAGVLPAVVAMLAARAECPLDRLDEALLLTDAVAAYAPGRSRDGHVRIQVDVDADGLEIAVDDLQPGGADGIVADATLPDVGGVIERLADVVETEERDGAERLVLRMRYATPTSTAADRDNGA
jgi:hypothetical protein